LEIYSCISQLPKSGRRLKIIDSSLVICLDSISRFKGGEVIMVKKKKTKKTAQTCGPCMRCFGCFSIFLTGVGVGILVTNPVANPHPVRWGFALIVIGVLVYGMNVVTE